MGQESTSSRRAAVLGGGAWGTALARLMADNGFDTTIWAREPEVVRSINERHVNEVFLPECPLEPGVSASGSVPETVQDAQCVLVVVPTQFLRAFISLHRDELPTRVPIVTCSKGIENETLQTPYEILRDELPGKYHNFLACLSGPSFAKEVALGLPTNVVVAAPRMDLAESVQKLVYGKTFRAYVSTDVLGVEVGGAVKNVIAISCGASDGYGFGHNARAGMMTRGLAEMTRLAVAKGANPLTLAGLSGMGDLVLTCTSDLSRNRMVGFRLGKGEPLDQILGSMKQVAEGVATSRSVFRLSEQLQVEMPITRAVYQVLHEGKELAQAVGELMGRPARTEHPDFK
ncbi:MAG: NAD(P)-dependent glycerol-3-phosphate dehydrogenase [Bradymonadales bacterium]|nr:NAD(P)-dependent glycerol-3-phosphate dehydrogenase [Bradymonadales bacterium]